MHDDNISSDDSGQLLDLCKHELLDKKVIEVYWMNFSDDLGLKVESSTTTSIELCFGPMHWELRDVNTQQMIVSSKMDFDTFCVPVEQLLGAKIVKLDIRKEDGLSLDVYFDSGKLLQLEPCEQIDEEIKSPCWELFCADGYVIKVGMEMGQWKRRPSTTPFWE